MIRQYWGVQVRDKYVHLLPRTTYCLLWRSMNDYLVLDAQYYPQFSYVSVQVGTFRVPPSIFSIGAPLRSGVKNTSRCCQQLVVISYSLVNDNVFSCGDVNNTAESGFSACVARCC